MNLSLRNEGETKTKMMCETFKFHLAHRAGYQWLLVGILFCKCRSPRWPWYVHMIKNIQEYSYILNLMHVEEYNFINTQQWKPVKFYMYSYSLCVEICFKTVLHIIQFFIVFKNKRCSTQINGNTVCYMQKYS